MKYYNLFIFSLIIFSSCVRNKSINTEVEKIRIDTVRDYKVITKFKPIHDTLTIENACDSSGILTRFYTSLTIPSGRLIIRSQNGSIKATIDLDSVANVYDSKYKAKYKNEVKFIEKIVIKKVVPVWAIITILLQSFIIILYFYFRFINPFR